MNALHEQFVTEARELIHQAGDDLIAVEREGASPERIDRIFRAFHTLKGSAGVVELSAMILSLHAAEDLLAAIHGGRMAVTPAMIEVALACLDQVSQWVDDFETQGGLPVHAGQDAQSMAGRIRDLLSEPTSQTSGRSDRSASESAGKDAVPEWLTRLLAAERSKISRHLQEQPGKLVALWYEPRPGCFFDGDDPLALIRAMPNLLALNVEARGAWPPPAELDPYACNLRIQAIAAGSPGDLAGIFRLVADQICVIEIPSEALPGETGARTDGDGRAELVRAILEEQRRVLNAVSRSDDMTGRVSAAARASVNALGYCQRIDLVKLIELAVKPAIALSDAAVLISAIDDALAALASGVGDGGDDTEGGGQLLLSGTDEAGRAATRLLRIDEARIDTLFNLAGELIVAKNSLAHLARRIEDEVGRNELTSAVKQSHESIGRLAGEMHGAILQLRMVPVAQVFRSFPRLVRDMAHRFDKKVACVTHGETEVLDKAIIDRLFEPLLHLVRNALDHGIETSQQRRAAGKAEAATVTISASRVGNRLVIEVSDDGRGIDPQIVRDKARERALLTAEELAALSDEQVLELIFSPGFSTATEVSDISGRGIGMDVVRSTVEQIGGRVSLSSRVGAGTAVRLDLPLNIAMTRIMVVESRGQVFGIPMDAVTETVRLTPDRISYIKGNNAFVLRDRIVPICSLAELMNLPSAPTLPAGSGLLVVIEASGKIVAIEVDAIRDRFEVVLKPMQGLLSEARGYAGTTLLGDGNVLLVLDVKEIVP